MEMFFSITPHPQLEEELPVNGLKTWEEEHLYLHCPQMQAYKINNFHKTKLSRHIYHTHNTQIHLSLLKNTIVNIGNTFASFLK